MANNPLGNCFIEGPLGVVNLTFNSVDLGRAVNDTEMELIEDIKDIFYAQDGTQPADKIPTGQAYQLTFRMGEPTWERLNEASRGLTVSSTGKSALLGRDIYRSGKDSFAKQLDVYRVDSDGASSTDDFYKAVFWKAMPTVSGSIGAFGPDTQREVEVIFYIFYDATNSGYGYSGYASSLGL